LHPPVRGALRLSRSRDHDNCAGVSETFATALNLTVDVIDNADFLFFPAGPAYGFGNGMAFSL
jgi:hypothetical protein